MNRNDRRIAIAALILGVLALVGLFVAGEGDGAYGAHESHESHKAPETYEPHEPHESRIAVVETFPFDPNTADSTQLLRLGLQPWQVRNIYKYRAHGGIYRCKEDFARLYGLTVKDYRRLEPYIRISNDYLPASTLVEGRRNVHDERIAGRQKDTVRERIAGRQKDTAGGRAVSGQRDTSHSYTPLYPVKLKDTERVVLNTADTTQLKRVPGIGSYFARRIMRYGQQLGGYVSIDQLDEIEDFPEDAKKYFVIEQPVVRKVNVNQLTVQQLRRHPYINYFQAKEIVNYRRTKGPLHSLDELRLSRDFPPEAIRRLEPYVEF